MKVLKAISPYIVIIGIIVLLVVIVSSFLTGNKMDYSVFLRELQSGNVESVKLEGNKGTAVLKADSATDSELKAGKYTFYVLSHQAFEEEIIKQVNNGNDVKYTPKIQDIPFIVRVLPYILIVILFLIFLYIFLGQGQGGTSGRVMSFGKSKARLYTNSKITFADVAGADEEKEELMELVSFLKDPKRYSMLGARIPKGVLMVGPPGTGKTYLAKAVAGEASVPFFSISGSDFVEMYVGVGASRVRDLFEQAKKEAPCIVFIDEIDAVGRKRGAGIGGGHDEREQTLNQLLVEMDGFGINEGVIVMAATNRPDILDPALTRPGRFDRKIAVGYPDVKARELMLMVHAKNKPLDDNVDLSDVAKVTAGFTAAELENLLNEAALLAARDKLNAISPENIKEATYRVIVGPDKKSRVMNDKDKRITAIHEAGHAVVVKIKSTTDKVDRISIIPTGMAGGYTVHRPDEDVNYRTKAQLMEEIMIALGGKAAEEVLLSEISTGATSDLKHANAVAYDMVTKYGMSSVLGNMIYGSDGDVFLGRDYGHSREYSDETAAKIDREVQTIVDGAYEEVKALMEEYRDKINKIADALIKQERIEGEEFERLMRW